jgi:predicted dehydrogenase
MINVAVVGVGYLGRFHAQKYAALPNARLIAVCDPDTERARMVAQENHTQAITDYRQLIGKVDAVSIATPTPYHFAIGEFFLMHGVHVLMEKPITRTIEEADRLIELAETNHLILQTGHLERFNNAVTAVRPYLHAPRFIESTRLAPFKLRGTDVNVILDLMIHDIDLIQSMVDADIENIDASGAIVLSQSIDIANVRIKFTNGCVANVTASRISLRPERTLRIFQSNNYLVIDLTHKRVALYKKDNVEIHPGIPRMTREMFRFEKGDALHDQIKSFLYCIETNTKPEVCGLAGKKALETAMRITDIVHQNNDRYHSASFQDDHAR